MPVLYKQLVILGNHRNWVREDVLQVPSNLPQIDPRTLVVRRLSQTLLLSTWPQTPAALPLVACYDMLGGALGQSPLDNLPGTIPPPLGDFRRGPDNDTKEIR